MSDRKQRIDPIISDLAGKADMRELVETFVNELPQRIDALEKKLAAHDMAGLGNLAHQLKSAARGHGFPAMSRQAAEVESSIEAHESLNQIAREIHELAELCSRAKATPSE